MDKLHSTIINLTEEFQYDQDKSTTKIQMLINEYLTNQRYDVIHQSDLFGLKAYPISKKFHFINHLVSLYFKEDTEQVVLVLKNEETYTLFLLASTSEKDWLKIEDHNDYMTFFTKEPYFQFRKYAISVVVFLLPLVMIGLLIYAVLKDIPVYLLALFEFPVLLVWLILFWIYKKIHLHF